MKAEKILEYAMEIKSCMSEEDKNFVDRIVRDKKPNDYINCMQKSVALLIIEARKELALLIIEARKELAKEGAKSNGRKDMLALANLIMRNGKNNDRFCGAFYQTIYNSSDNHQYFCDGYMVLRLKDRFDVKEISQGVTPLNIQGVSKWNPKAMTEIKNVPTIAELKEHIIRCKVEGKVDGDRVISYDFGEDLPSVNAKWLLQALKAFPNGKLYSEDGISHKGIKLCVLDRDDDEGLLILGRRKF